MVDAVSDAIRIPLILGGAPAGLLDAEYLRARRVRVSLVVAGCELPFGMFWTCSPPG